MTKVCPLWQPRNVELFPEAAASEATKRSVISRKNGHSFVGYCTVVNILG